MTLVERLAAAVEAFRSPPPVRWVVAEHSVAWRIMYHGKDKADAERWMLADAKNRPADRFITVQPLTTIREWNTNLVESTAFWGHLVRLHRMIDSARTDALIDKVQAIGQLSHPGDTMEVTDKEGPPDD